MIDAYMPNLEKEVKDEIINEAQQAADEARQNKAFDELDSGAPHDDVEGVDDEENRDGEND